VAASVDLSRVPLAAREEVLGALERARAGKVRFTGHDGKDYDNWNHLLPPGTRYAEWTVAGPSIGRWEGQRIIFAGDPSCPSAVYYWDHIHPPIWIGPNR
jgi:guanyl-specific ribonuclease Sa